MRNFFVFFATAFSLISCQQFPATEVNGKIVCTTGMIGDAVKNLVGDSIEVHTLMGPGVDPHLYKASQGDIKELSAASVIVHNGLHLEGKLAELFSKMGKRKPALAMADGLNTNQLLNSTDFVDAHDPHIWFDVALWNQSISYISSELQKLYPNLADFIKSNEEAYKKELLNLHVYCLTQIRLIPDNQKIMITAHDAFKYFGRAYNIEVRGLQGISTTAEFGLRDISNLVQFVSEKKIKALFVESSVPQKSIEAVIEGCKEKGHRVSLGGELFSDAMGAQNTSEGTYIGMVKHNVNTIVNALR